MFKTGVVAPEHVERFILVVRGHRVLLDRDLAALYGVSTSNLNKAVGRNLARFPEDFMLQLTAAEMTNLKFQSGTSSWGGTRKPPRAFTEQGVAMLSSVLRSMRAVRVNIEIMRAFVRLRAMLQTNTELAKEMTALEKKYDAQFRVVFDAIRELMVPPARSRKRIGFHPGRTGGESVKNRDKLSRSLTRYATRTAATARAVAPRRSPTAARAP